MTQTKTLTALGTAIAAAWWSFSVRAEDADNSKFLREAIQTDIADVKMSELALQRSNDDGVRELAHRLQADHATSMQQTAALAKTLGVTIPSSPSAVDMEHYASLEKLSGTNFDATFVSHMVAGHREAINKFGEQTHANPNQAVAAFAEKTLPTLTEHLALAESLLAAGVHSSAEAHVSVDAPESTGAHESDAHSGHSDLHLKAETVERAPPKR